jgi:hypothetical protein
MCRSYAATKDMKLPEIRREGTPLYKAALALGKTGRTTHPKARTTFEAFLPLEEARKLIEPQRIAVDKALEALAAQLPVAAWITGVRGVGMLMLAKLVGEAGDIGSYRSVPCLWRRFGCAVMPDGTRQRKVTGLAGELHGFNPSRRAALWDIGDKLIRQNKPYKAIYDARKPIEAPRSQRPKPTSAQNASWRKGSFATSTELGDGRQHPPRPCGRG